MSDLSEDYTLTREEQDEIVAAIRDRGFPVDASLLQRRDFKASLVMPESMRDRLDMIAKLFGWPRSRVMLFALLIGVSAWEDEIVRAAEEAE